MCLLNNIHEKIGDGEAEETLAYRAIREILRHPRRALDLIILILIGSNQTLLFISQS